MAKDNSETFVTWKAYWKGAVASIAVVVTIVIAVAAAHTSRPHKGAVTNDSLQEHVSAARQERRDISLKIDHIETAVHSVEMEQAVMIETLNNVYEEVKKLK